MSIIPLHIQRRFEQRWAAQFGSLVIPAVPKTVRLKGWPRNLATRLGKSQRKTRRDGSAASRSCDCFSLSLSEGGRTMKSDLDSRNRIKNAKISRNYGTTLVRDLRERYGENFAAGHADTATLREIINRPDAKSLNRVQSDLEKGQLDAVGAFRPGPSRE